MTGNLISEDCSVYIHVFEFGPNLDLNINHRMFRGDRRGVLRGEFRQPPQLMPWNLTPASHKDAQMRKHNMYLNSDTIKGERMHTPSKAMKINNLKFDQYY